VPLKLLLPPLNILLLSRTLLLLPVKLLLFFPRSYHARISNIPLSTFWAYVIFESFGVTLPTILSFFIIVCTATVSTAFNQLLIFSVKWSKSSISLLANSQIFYNITARNTLMRFRSYFATSITFLFRSRVHFSSITRPAILYRDKFSFFTLLLL